MGEKSSTSDFPTILILSHVQMLNYKNSQIYLSKLAKTKKPSKMNPLQFKCYGNKRKYK